MSEVSIVDIPHTRLSESVKQQRRDLLADLDLCNIVTFHYRHSEHVKPQGHRVDLWPTDVRAVIESTVMEWLARNGGATVKAVTSYVEDGSCVLALHWRPKNGVAS